MSPSIARRERGAIAIHAALALIALLAFTSMVIDYGLMWVSRREARNARGCRRPRGRDLRCFGTAARRRTPRPRPKA